MKDIVLKIKDNSGNILPTIGKTAMGPLSVHEAKKMAKKLNDIFMENNLPYRYVIINLNQE